MPHQRSLLPFAVLVACLLCLSGCGTAVYQPSRVAGFELEPEQEIDDEAIGKAFSAKPQLPSKPRVAYYVFDDEHAGEVGTMLGALPSVTSTYRIPPLLVTGQRRFDDAHHGYEPRTPLSMKKLRLLAARAHADVLVVVDYGYRVTDSPNGLAALGVALVPLLFVPFRDVHVKSYVDSYVIDTRNGYLYGHLQTSEEQTSEYENLYSGVADELVERQLEKLVGDTGRLMKKLLGEERDGSVSPLKKEPAEEPKPKGGEPSTEDAAISARQEAADAHKR